VAHGLNVVSVVIENESGIVVQMVVRAKPRGPVILAARRERRSVELIDGWPIFRYEGDVHWLFQLSFATNPEIQLRDRPHFILIAPTCALPSAFAMEIRVLFLYLADTRLSSAARNVWSSSKIQPTSLDDEPTPLVQKRRLLTLKPRGGREVAWGLTDE
jgi:hypothetical protein